jgi:SEC-C motif-containing protein
MSSKNLAQPCPCGSGRAYLDCCQPIHANVNAPTPEALMRSRYSAYVLGQLRYLMDTWHASTAPGDLELPPTKWLGLEVLNHSEQGDAGVVEFVARYKVNGRMETLHEISRFVREGTGDAARWLYIDGQLLED